MKYKTMVLLEELVKKFRPENNYKIYFTYNFRYKCTGSFKKTSGKLVKEGKVFIDSKKLLKDYESYVLDNEASRQFLNKIFTDTYGDEFREEKIANYFLASMSNFLEDKETDVDNYLTGYDGPEIIYDLTTQDGYYGDFDMTGMDLKLLALYDLNLNKKSL